MALSAFNVTSLLSEMFNEAFLRNVSLTNQVVNIFKQYRDNDAKLLELSKKYGITVSSLQNFFNHTSECTETVSKELPRTSVLNWIVFVDKIRQNCLGMPALIPSEVFCSDKDFSGIIFMIMFSLGFVFLFSTSFMRQRKKFKPSCCNGYPGPVIPLNMLDSYENRRGFALAFGLTALYCINVLLGNYQSIYGKSVAYWMKSLPSFTSILVKIASAILISLASFPFFVCQNMKNRVFGSVLGIFFCVVWLTMELTRLFYAMDTCWKLWEAMGYGSIFRVIKTMFDYPLYICLCLLLCKNIWTLIRTLKQRHQRKQRGEHLKHWMFEDDTDWKSEYMYIHVRNLLKKVPRKLNDKDEEKELPEKGKTKTFSDKMTESRAQLKKKLQGLLYVYVPQFKYSTRMMASVFVTYIAMYHVTIFFAMYAYVIQQLLNKYVLDAGSVNMIAMYLDINVATIKETLSVATISWWLGLATGLIFSVLVMSNSVSWYRKHMLLLRKGDYTFLPRPLRKKKFNSASLLVASMKFAGFQVGYAVWGFLILVFLLFITYFIIITQIVFAIMYKRKTMLVSLFIDTWPTILIAIAIFILQYVTAIKWFLFDKLTLQVDNRRVYHIVSYTMFYFNIFLGMVSCLLRIIFSIITGTIFLQRLQKSTLPRAFELNDPGYASYLGYILLEHQHSNPVIQCFTRLLMESVNKQMSEEIHHKNENDFSKTRHGLMPCGFMDATDIKDMKKQIRNKIRIRIRWHLFIILSLNPTLLKYRFKNPKKKRYNLDLFNRLNPRLTWKNDWFNGLNVSESEDERQSENNRTILPSNAVVISPGKYGNLETDTGKKVGVQYHRSGTVLQITYTINEAELANEADTQFDDSSSETSYICKDGNEDFQDNNRISTNINPNETFIKGEDDLTGEDVAQRKKIEAVNFYGISETAKILCPSVDVEMQEIITYDCSQEDSRGVEILKYRKLDSSIDEKKEPQNMVIEIESQTNSRNANDSIRIDPFVEIPDEKANKNKNIDEKNAFNEESVNPYKNVSTEFRKEARSEITDDIPEWNSFDNTDKISLEDANFSSFANNGFEKEA